MPKYTLLNVPVVDQSLKDSIPNMTSKELQELKNTALEEKKYHLASYVSREQISRKQRLLYHGAYTSGSNSAEEYQESRPGTVGH